MSDLPEESREVRRLIRERGAGTRDLATASFDFVFGVPIPVANQETSHNSTTYLTEAVSNAQKSESRAAITDAPSAAKRTRKRKPDSSMPEIAGTVPTKRTRREIKPEEGIEEDAVSKSYAHAMASLANAGHQITAKPDSQTSDVLSKQRKRKALALSRSKSTAGKPYENALSQMTGTAAAMDSVRSAMRSTANYMLGFYKDHDGVLSSPEKSAPKASTKPLSAKRKKPRAHKKSMTTDFPQAVSLRANGAVADDVIESSTSLVESTTIQENHVIVLGPRRRGRPAKKKQAVAATTFNADMGRPTRGRGAKKIEPALCNPVISKEATIEHQSDQLEQNTKAKSFPESSSSKPCQKGRKTRAIEEVEVEAYASQILDVDVMDLEIDRSQESTLKARPCGIMEGSELSPIVAAQLPSSRGRKTRVPREASASASAFVGREKRSKEYRLTRLPRDDVADTEVLVDSDPLAVASSAETTQLRTAAKGRPSATHLLSKDKHDNSRSTSTTLVTACAATETFVVAGQTLLQPSPRSTVDFPGSRMKGLSTTNRQSKAKSSRPVRSILSSRTNNAIPMQERCKSEKAQQPARTQYRSSYCNENSDSSSSPYLKHYPEPKVPSALLQKGGSRFKFNM